MRSFFFILLVVFFFNTSFSESLDDYRPETIPTESLQNFDANHENVKAMISLALNLAGKNIGYQYGSAIPESGGMDCSGTIYYILTMMGIKDVPRSSHILYQWVWEKGKFYPVNSYRLNSFEFSHLKPGDLLFWSGTYATDRDPNVTHVMIYIGKNNAGEPLMAGASNGRTYKGRKIYGVSVFNFLLPSPTGKSRFLGYSCVPSYTCK